MTATLTNSPTYGYSLHLDPQDGSNYLTILADFTQDDTVATQVLHAADAVVDQGDDAVERAARVEWQRLEPTVTVQNVHITRPDFIKRWRSHAMELASLSNATETYEELCAIADRVAELAGKRFDTLFDAEKI